MREWLVAGAIIQSDDGLLLVQNLRRGGVSDWTPPGGVIEASERRSIREGLRREVTEETGLEIVSWGPMLYEVETEAPGLGWIMRAQIWQVEAVAGELQVGNDPDGIVVDAKYVPVHECNDYLDGTHAWVSEPLLEWLDAAVETAERYRFRLEHQTSGPARIVRL